MRNLIIAALLALVGWAFAPVQGHAQSLERLCVATYNSNTGQINCHEGWTPFLLNGLTTTVTQVKGSAGQVGTVICYNSNASVAYIQLFDAATAASVTLGTTKPIQSYGIPGTLSSGTGPSPLGISFTNGLQVAVTTTATGSTAPGNAMDCDLTYN